MASLTLMLFFLPLGGLDIKETSHVRTSMCIAILKNGKTIRKAPIYHGV